ncbi:putative reverse transcriptase/RNA-dependent DNA polymerase [Citrus sinensis]|uniref:Reverse transcriptase/RNA-dependent DNA polymerase n=1 Tax=Citrus sinensis TaxID=2711 RepID=A0ACB8INS3_CITSI|nr:putative reverse transcriptase/RNA-dependent DNA polymerase [Citrus sinensis]
MSPEANVAELIDKENRWKTEVIQHNFLKDDAEEILSIPLPRREMEDNVIWHYDKHGRYYVKSMYQVALKMKFSDLPSWSDSRGNNWGIIWKLNIPEKIKIFIWKVAKNLLSTVENLWKRKIIQEAHCKRCGEGMENIWHALISCKAARKVWHSSTLASGFQDMRSSDMLGELMRLQKNLSRADLELLVTTLWKSKFKGDVSYVEVEAAEWGLCIAKEAGLKPVILETDSQEVANLINKRKASSTEIFWRVQEIQAMMKDFSLFEAKHVPRFCNFCAHSLAKLTLGRANSDVWWGNFPPEILHVL